MEPQPPAGKPSSSDASANLKQKPAPPTSGPVSLFRGVDWLTCLISFLVVFAGYYWTLSPDVTLEDSGELAVASYYAGVPHPPGYPVWTVYTWLFTELLPFSNIAWRVAVSSAFAGALACAILGMMVSRGSSMVIEGFEELKGMDRRLENWVCLISGYVAAMLMGFNGYMWSQAVIVEVYTVSVLTMALVLVWLMRWMYAPHQWRYLFAAFFMFGVCFTTHQTLLLAAVGVQVAIAVANPKLGRDFFIVNVFCWIAGLIMDGRTQGGGIGSFHVPGMPGKVTMIYYIFNFIGFFSLAAAVWLIIQTKKAFTEILPVIVCGVLWIAGAALYFYMPVASMTNPPLNWGYPRTKEGFFHALSRGQYERTNPTDLINDPSRLFTQIIGLFEGAVEEFNLVYLVIALIPVVFFAVRIWREGAKRELGVALGIFGALCASFLFAIFLQKTKNINALPFLATLNAMLLLAFFVTLLVAATRYLSKAERAWLFGLSAVYVCLAFLLLIMLNPGTDRQSQSLNKVFFTSSHMMVCMFAGYGLALLSAVLATNYAKARVPMLSFATAAAGVALYVVVVKFANVDPASAAAINGLLDCNPTMDPIQRYTAIFSLVLALITVGGVALWRQRAPMGLLLAVFVAMPAWSCLSHWYDNEQRGHLFGFWFGHDMFTPPFKDPKTGELIYERKRREELMKDPAQAKYIYPEMTRDAILFGGTDPGRFNPTYMIFCESFTKPEHRRNPEFDRRDVVLITQNALADGTYLNYIRAHYNRSAQEDPPFFQEFFSTKVVSPLDNFFIKLGDDVEKRRRAGSSFFQPGDFKNLASLKARLDKPATPLAHYLRAQLKPETLALLNGDEAALRKALAADLNRLIDAPSLFDPARFEGVKLTERSQAFAMQNPKLHNRVRLNRLLLEEAFPGDIALSEGGVYPDREILTPTVPDSQKAFSEYMEDVAKRQAVGQLRPGEDVRNDNGRVQVSGQVAVMAINALLCRVIFDKNPGHEFFIEESFPLDWMYPYLSPFGVIMKINRNPMAEMPLAEIERDHRFWKDYSARFVGDWIEYDTPVSNICAWAEKTYIQKDYDGFKGDMKFVRDDNGQKAFSKLRSSIGGVYAWRVNHGAPAERARMIREAEFTFKQAFAFCPYSPEAVFRYINLILQLNDPARLDDAIAIGLTCQKLDPLNPQINGLVEQLHAIKADSKNRVEALRTQQAALAQARTQIAAAASSYQTNPGNVQKAFELAQLHLNIGDTNNALLIFDRLLAQTNIGPNEVLSIAQAYMQFSQVPRLERALQKLVQLNPTHAESWYDLAGVQALLTQQRPNLQGLAIESLRRALTLSNERLKTTPAANNLQLSVLKDQRFDALRANPEFLKLLDLR